AVAYKEWAGVCAALAAGRQTILVRKGGIEEGPGGFTPEHSSFWFYPTNVHEPQHGLREPFEPSTAHEPDPRFAELRSLGVVAHVGFVEREDALPALADWHVWTENTLRARFHYRRPGLWVIGVRVFSRPDPWRLEVAPAQRGCKSWVSLEAALPTGPLR